MSKTDELRSTFFQESEDLLESLADGLIELASGPVDMETVNSVFRAVHSIKGGAGAFSLDAVVQFAHRYENVLDALRNSRISVNPQVLEVLTRAADHLTGLVEAARDDTEADTVGSEDLIAELATFTGEDESTSEPQKIDFVPQSIAIDGLGSDVAEQSYKIRFMPSPGLYTSGNEPAFLLRDLCALGSTSSRCDVSQLPLLAEFDPNGAYLAWDIDLKTDADETAIRDVFEFVDGHCELTVAPVRTGEGSEVVPELPSLRPPEEIAQNAGSGGVTEPDQSLKPQQPPAQPVASTIRVELHRIDRMINLVGELVINQAMLSQCIKRAEVQQGGDIEVGLDELRTLTRQIQDSVMAIRAQPVKALFQRMSRIAREAGNDVGKTLRVITEGASTEIDKTVIEKLADPLTHMIRNAVDHGLESTDTRREKGKDATGVIRLSAAHLSGRVIIEIGDDGAGINRDKVRQIAEDKGLISPDAQLTPQEIDNLIFAPGFSTATTLSNLSGRGVGMDVVKRAIQSLGGRVSISSQAGAGSIFSIVLPLTLAVLDGMVIGVGGQTVVVPISAIVETMRLDAGHVFRLGTDNSVVRVRGTYVPIVDVGAILGYRPPVEDPEKCVFLLVETADGPRSALLIDQIHDQRQVVIKGLEENYGHVEGVAAATILGDGRIALILDPSAIVGAAGIDSMAATSLAAE